MSGLIGGKGSQSSLITSISGVNSHYGGTVDLNHLVYQMFDSNMNTPSSSGVTNFNSDNNVDANENIRLHHPADRATQAYYFLFGPNYTSVDVANGGWRIGFSFRVTVRIDYVIVSSASTNARPKNFGIYHKPNYENNTGITFHQMQGGRVYNARVSLNITQRTLFGVSTNCTVLDNSNTPQIILYEDLVGQHFLVTFGDEYHDNGNANAGVGSLNFYGQALV